MMNNPTTLTNEISNSSTETSNSIPITPYHNNNSSNNTSFTKSLYMNDPNPPQNPEYIKSSTDDFLLNHHQQQQQRQLMMMDTNKNSMASIANTSENAIINERYNQHLNQPRHYFYGSDLVRNTDGTPLLDHNQKVVTVAKMLATKPLKHELATRPGPGGKKLTYLSGDSVTRTLNDIFGFDGWCLEVKERKREICEKDSSGRFVVAYTAKVRVTHRLSGAFKEDCGAGDAVDKSLPTAVSNALKSSITDAMKRAVRHFGDKLGNSLYESKFNINNAPRTLTEAFNQYDYDRANKKFGRQSNNDNKDISSSTATPIRQNEAQQASILVKTKETLSKNNSILTGDINSKLNSVNNVAKPNLEHQQRQHQAPPQQHLHNEPMSHQQQPKGSIRPQNNNLQENKSQSQQTQQSHKNATTSNNHASSLMTSNNQKTALSSHNNASMMSGGISRFKQTTSSTTNQPSSSTKNVYTKNQQQYNNALSSTASPRLNGLNSTSTVPKSIGDGPLSTMPINNLGRPTTTRGGRNMVVNYVQNVYGSSLSTSIPTLPTNSNENNVNGKRIASMTIQQQVVKKPNIYNNANNPYISKKV